MLLKDLPAFVITLDRDAERYDAFYEHTGRFLCDLRKVSGVDGRLADIDKVCEWADAANASVNKLVEDSDADRALYMQYKCATSEGHRYTFPSRRVRKEKHAYLHVSGMYGLWSSHRLAIQQGLDAGLDRWLVLEDDATVRQEALEFESPSTDVVLWGSMTMGSLKQDAIAYSKARSYRWARPLNMYACLLATATEYSREGAEAVLSATDRYPGQFDAFWWEALRKLNVSKLVPMAFTQTGLSTRGNRRDIK